MKKYSAVLLNALIIVLGVCGIGFTLFSEGFMNADTFLYYTVQSNLLVIFTAAVVLFFEYRRLREGKEVPREVQFLRLFSTVAITLTFLVFSLMLTPQMLLEGNGAYLTTPGNLFVHNLVPIGAILDFCFFGSVKNLKKRCGFCGLIPALAYLFFVFICVACGVTFSGNTVPYFFVDFKTYGWLRISGAGIGVLYWVLILAVLLIGLGFGYMAVARKRENRKAMDGAPQNQ